MVNSGVFSNIIKLVLSVALVLQLAAGQSNSSRAVCHVTAHSSLVQCLENPTVTQIVLEGDYSIGSSFEKYASTPLPITRNVTIEGPANRQLDDYPVLDFGMVDGAVQLCSGCIVTLTRLVIKGDRKGSGPVYDLFVGQPGPVTAQVRSINTLRVRAACTPAAGRVRSIRVMRRSQLFPNSTAAQAIRVADVTYRGKVYKDSLVTDHISFDVPYKVDEGSRRDEGGFAQLGQNAGRLCESYVNEACLAVMTADACVQQMIDALNAPAKPPGLAPAATAAIIVPLVAGFLLAAGFLVWWLKRRTARRSTKGSPLDCVKPDQSGQLLCSTAPGYTGGSGSSSSDRPGSGGPCLGKPLGRTTGWELMDSRTAPSMDHVDNKGIELGTFIGAGSFGKVFKGTWNDMDVAVKVIEHSGSTADGVQQEMELLMSFQHDNIVRAYYCMTYVHRNGAPESECSGSFASAHNSGGKGSANSLSNSFAFPTASGTASSTATPVLGPYGSRGGTLGQRAGSGGCMSPTGQRRPSLTITEGAPYSEPPDAQCSTDQPAAATGYLDGPYVCFAEQQAPGTAQQAAHIVRASSDSSQAVGSGSGSRQPVPLTEPGAASADCRVETGDITAQSHLRSRVRRQGGLRAGWCSNTVTRGL